MDREEMVESPIAEERKKRLVAAKAKGVGLDPVGLGASLEMADSAQESAAAADVVDGTSGSSIDVTAGERIEEEAPYKEEGINPGASDDEELVKEAEQRVLSGDSGAQRFGRKAARTEGNELEFVMEELRMMREAMAESERKRSEEDRKRRFRDEQRDLEERSLRLRLEEEEFKRRKAEEERRRDEDDKRKKDEEDKKDKDEERVETVKTTVTLTKLAGVKDEPEPAVRFGDWMEVTELKVKTMSASSGKVWKEARESAEWKYSRYLKASAVDRLAIVREEDSLVVDKKLELISTKISECLLDVIPQSIGKELVSNRTTKAPSIIFKLMTVFQPGGIEERAGLLSKLAKFGSAENAAGVVQEIGMWNKRRKRAEELGLSVPDPSLILKELGELTGKVMAKDARMNFQVEMFRNLIKIDQEPTMEKVLNFIELIEAECAARVTSEEPNIKAKRMEAGKGSPGEKGSPNQGKGAGGIQVGNDWRGPRYSWENGKGKANEKGNSGEGKGESKGKGKSEVPCKNWCTDQGCPYGQKCIFQHPKPKQEECLVCGATDHRRETCSRPKEKWTLNQTMPAWPFPGTNEKGKGKGGGKSWEKGTGGSSGSSSNMTGQQITQAVVKAMEAEKKDEKERQEKEKKEQEEKEKKEREKEKESVNSELMKALKNLSKLRMMKEVGKKGNEEERIVFASMKTSRGRGCVDSGANRAARSMSEEERAFEWEETVVELADGTKRSCIATTTMGRF